MRYADCMTFTRRGEYRFVVAFNRIHTTLFPTHFRHGSPRQGSRVLGRYPGRCPGLGWSAPVGAFGGRASHLAGVSVLQWGQRAGWVRRAADHMGLWRGSVGLKRGSVRRELDVVGQELGSVRRELDVVRQELGLVRRELGSVK